jgi:hypothetical protein
MFIFDLRRFEMFKHFIDNGMSVFPVRTDGSKAPACKSWSIYRERFASPEEVSTWEGKGIGLVCGAIGDQEHGIEVLDFDCPVTAGRFMTLPDISPLIGSGDIPVIRTGSGGFHVLYRIPIKRLTGNRKLAMSEGQQTLIETRGSGGYVVTVGSPSGTHSEGGYTQIRGPAIPENPIPIISNNVHRTLRRCCTIFDETGLREEVYKAKVRAYTPPPAPRFNSEGEPPWERYAREFPVGPLLEEAGYRTRDGVHYTRPDKDQGGTSGTVRRASDGNEVFISFSTNGPLCVEPGRSQSKFNSFQVLAKVRFGGDFKLATKSVAAMFSTQEEV